MKKNTLHKIIIPLLLIVGINQILTGIFGRQLSHQTFELLHKGGGFVFAMLAVIHLIMNFSWVKASYFSK